MLFNKKQDTDSRESSYSTNAQDTHEPAISSPPLSQSFGQRKQASPPRSVIDPWLTITGDLQSEGDVQVDGQIHGDIRCTQLTVSKDAKIEGNIAADEVVVRGMVKGIIRANRVLLQDTAYVESEIFHKSLAIEQGATFDGQSRNSEEPLKVAEPVAEAAE
jgi:cytoskeletal protein CcmA (bactofilin family)